MLNGASIEFELVKDVPDGGVLFALPALLLLGLLNNSREMFWMPEGFYPLESIFVLLALIALARIPSLEACKRLTNYTVYGDRYFRAAQALGVSSATRLFGKSAKPGSTELR